MPESRENCFYLNATIRDTVKVLRLMSRTATLPVTASEVAEMAELPEEFCLECLINLAFDEIIRETDQGFQTLGLEVGKLDPRVHKILDQSFDDRGLPPPRVRRRTGEWAT